MTANTLQSTPSAHHRFHLLDGMRGIAAILVVCWHAPSYLFAHGTHSNFLAVDFFFCLSGFIISFAYESRLRESLSFGRFVAARLIRLYPLFLLAALIYLPFFLYTEPHRARHLTAPVHLGFFVIAQLLMVPNLGLWKSIKLYPILLPAWSLFFELLANFALGFLLKIRAANRKQIASLYLVALAAMIYWAHVHHGIDVGWQSNHKDFFATIARVTLSFTAGILAYRIFLMQSVRHFTPRTSAVFAVVLVATLLLMLLTPFLWMTTTRYQLVALGLGFPAVVSLGALCRVPKVWHRGCEFLGDTSYPVYLLHYCILAPILIWPLKTQFLIHPAAAPMLMSALVLIVLCVAYLVQRHFETPVRKYLTQLSNQSLSAQNT